MVVRNLDKLGEYISESIFFFTSSAPPGLVMESMKLSLQQLLLMHTTNLSLIRIKDFLSSSKSAVT